MKSGKEGFFLGPRIYAMSETMRVWPAEGGEFSTLLKLAYAKCQSSSIYAW